MQGKYSRGLLSLAISSKKDTVVSQPVIKVDDSNQLDFIKISPKNLSGLNPKQSSQAAKKNALPAFSG